MVKNPTWKEVNQLAIFTSVVKDLKSGLTENESSEQSEQDMKSCCLFLSKFTMIISTHYQKNQIVRHTR